MSNCVLCGQAGSEVTQRRDGVVGNYHTNCAYIAYLEAHPDHQTALAHLKADITHSRIKLVHKRQGVADEFP